MSFGLRVAVLDDYQGAALASTDWSRLQRRADVTVFGDHLTAGDAIAARLRDFGAVIAMRERTPFPRGLLERLPRLRLLVTAGLANAAIDVGAARELGVTVCGTRGSLVPARELTWALILAVTRGIAAEDAAVRGGRWQTGIGPELADATLGILGLGNLGQAIARYAHAFEMNVVAWSPNLTAEKASAHGATLVSRRELFELSDIVTIHLRLSERSRGLVGAAELRWLGPRGYLVNTSRGPIVDEAALIAALDSGTIAGAALDVFDTEPLPPGHPLLSVRGTVLTPHIGFVSTQAYARIYADAVEDILAWLDGVPIRVLAP
jgi:phosphoglycerate dehydrogenase-like enzyme